jgi:hypothetical protein
MNIMTDGTGIMGDITNNIGLTMESDVFSPVSVVVFFFPEIYATQGIQYEEQIYGASTIKDRYQKLWKITMFNGKIHDFYGHFQ